MRSGRRRGGAGGARGSARRCPTRASGAPGSRPRGDAVRQKVVALAGSMPISAKVTAGRSFLPSSASSPLRVGGAAPRCTRARHMGPVRRTGEQGGSATSRRDAVALEVLREDTGRTSVSRRGRSVHSRSRRGRRAAETVARRAERVRRSSTARSASTLVARERSARGCLRGAEHLPELARSRVGVGKKASGVFAAQKRPASSSRTGRSGSR